MVIDVKKKVRFTEGFVRLIDRYRIELEEEVDSFLLNRDGLEHDVNYNGAFILIMECLISGSWRFMGLLRKFEKNFPSDRWTPSLFRDINVRQALSGLEHRTAGDVVGKVDKFLTQLETTKIMDWLKGRYKMRKDL